MAEFALGEKITARMVCYTNTQIGINRVYGMITGIVGAAVTATNVAAQIDGDLHALYKIAMSSVAKYRGVGVRNLTTRAAEATVIANDGFGTSVFPILPTQVRGLVSYKTSFVGVAGSGRHYIPFPSSDLQDNDGSPTNAYVALINQIGDEWTTNMVVVNGASTLTITWGLATWAPGPRRVPLNVIAFASRTGRKKFATQRRSGQYGKINILPF